MGSSDLVFNELIPGLPDELSLLCLSKLPLDVLARCRAVSQSWSSHLSHHFYVAASRSSPVHALAFFFTAHVDPITRESSMAWVLVSPSDLRSFCLPFFHLPKPPQLQKIHVYSSKMQIIPTGTTLLLVRSMLQFTPNQAARARNSHGAAPHHAAVLNLSCDDDDAYQATMMPGLLQGFDLWRMKWCRGIVGKGGTLKVMPMHVDRWQFATGHCGIYVYVAGGEGVGAGATAEKLDMQKGMWEMLPDMIKDRSENPMGFVMDGCFFVVGGEFQPTTSTQGRGLTQSIEYYDPSKNAWMMMEGMWPQEMWGYTNVAVVRGAAFAKGAKAEVVRLTRTGDEWWRWEVVGLLPILHEEEAAINRWRVRLLSVGEQELWAILAYWDPDRPQQELVFSCRPHLGSLQWHRLPLTLPTSPVLASFGIYL